jgi:hypothetical protein
LICAESASTVAFRRRLKYSQARPGSPRSALRMQGRSSTRPKRGRRHPPGLRGALPGRPQEGVDLCPNARRRREGELRRQMQPLQTPLRPRRRHHRDSTTRQASPLAQIPPRLSPGNLARRPPQSRRRPLRVPALRWRTPSRRLPERELSAMRPGERFDEVSAQADTWLCRTEASPSKASPQSTAELLGVRVIRRRRPFAEFPNGRWRGKVEDLERQPGRPPAGSLQRERARGRARRGLR